MKEYFELLMRNGVTPNGLFVLHALHGNLAYSNYLNLSVELHRLSLSKHVSEVNNAGKINTGKTYQITLKGELLLKEAEQMMMKVKPRKKLQVAFETWEEHIKKFIALFPAGTQGGQPIRTSPKVLFPRFQWFFLENPDYTWDMVLQATQAYLDYLSGTPDQFKYITTTKYFVMREERSKMVSSKLADWCASVQDGTVDDISNHGKRLWAEDAV